MSEKMLITIRDKDDGNGVIVEMDGEISCKALIFGATVFAARTCKLAEISPEEFLVLLYVALQKENGEDDNPET